MNFARFGSKTQFSIKSLNDSAWLLLEKLKNHFFFNYVLRKIVFGLQTTFFDSFIVLLSILAEI